MLIISIYTLSHLPLGHWPTYWTVQDDGCRWRCWKCSAATCLGAVAGAGDWIKWSWISDFGRLLVGVVLGLLPVQHRSSSLAAVCLFWLNLFFSFTPAHETPAHFSPNWTHSHLPFAPCSNICLILLDIHGLLCYITLVFYWVWFIRRWVVVFTARGVWLDW